MRDCVVEVEFQVGTKHFKVIRGIKPVIFEIYVNDVLYNQDAHSKDYQKYLEQQILKLNYGSFTQVVILGSSTFIPFMQLKARHRREVVEEILDIQIFSLMNLLLKQELKGIADEIRETSYQYDLTEEKVKLQENYIDDLKKNKNSHIKKKVALISDNDEDIFKIKSSINTAQKNNEKFLEGISDQTNTNEKITKLSDIKATLTEKHKNHSNIVGFFENNDDCPTCEQHIDELFKKDMIIKKQEDVDKVMSGLTQLEIELEKSNKRMEEISVVAEKIRENEVYIAEQNSSLTQLEKFNSTLQSEINVLAAGDVVKSDHLKLKELKSLLKDIDVKKSQLNEEEMYAEIIKNMLQDTGIKTKIIKQYLPIMNKLINTYLSSMDFYINFTLNENFDETIKSRYRDEFTYDSFSEGEKQRIDLALLFTWRAIAKMKNSTNTNLLMLDEIFDSSLDESGTDEFLKILQTLDKENVFVISHKQDVFVDKFEDTIKFEKVKSFTRMII
tara:strand:+ start:2177 stop:3679 length:1503 start_codon:yes stop_codon:yes gene_type:complete